MSEEIVTQEVELDEETDTEEVDLEVEEEIEDTEEIDIEDVADAEPIDWEARAKKAEALLVQRKKQAKEVKTQNTPSLSEEVVEKKILQSQGMSEDLLKQLTKIARVNGTGLIEAQQDPIFIAIKEKAEEDAEKARTRLKASKGSGQVRKGKDFTTRDLTEEEHKQLWRDRQGN